MWQHDNNETLALLFHLLQLDNKNCAAIEGINKIPDNDPGC